MKNMGSEFAVGHFGVQSCDPKLGDSLVALRVPWSIEACLPTLTQALGLLRLAAVEWLPPHFFRAARSLHHMDTST